MQKLYPANNQTILKLPTILQGTMSVHSPYAIALCTLCTPSVQYITPHEHPLYTTLSLTSHVGPKRHPGLTRGEWNDYGAVAAAGSSRVARVEPRSGWSEGGRTWQSRTTRSQGDNNA